MRSIDEKYHTDGKHVIKSTNGSIVPEDEPMFLFRAKDRLALRVLEFYKSVCEIDGCTRYQIEGIERAIGRFRGFQLRSPEKMKQPGSTKGK